jgi:hypothetical protein
MTDQERRSQIARELASIPRRKRGYLCELCGKEFTAGPHARWCSRSCSSKAFRAAHPRKEEETEEDEIEAA